MSQLTPSGFVTRRDSGASADPRSPVTQTQVVFDQFVFAEGNTMFMNVGTSVMVQETASCDTSKPLRPLDGVCSSP